MAKITFVQNPDAIASTPTPVEKQVTDMHLQLETITPELAQQFLDRNTDNRPHKERHVRFLADQMRAGAWQITGDPIKIGKSGRLLDGQHRLMAIVQSETTQRLYVARDCEEEIFAVLDTGRSRSAADVLATAGLKNSTAVSAAAKLLIMHERGVLAIMGGKQRAATNAQILAYTAQHDVEASASKASAWSKRCKLLNPGEWVAMHYLLAKKAPQQADEFLQQITTGLNLTEGHPVLILRQRLQAARDGRFNFTAAERMAMTVKAWNAHREGRKIGQLTWKNYEEFPEIA